MLKRLLGISTLLVSILNMNNTYAGWCDAGNRSGAASFIAAAGSDSLVSNISTSMTSVGGTPGLGMSYRRCTWDNIIPEDQRCWTENQFFPTGCSSDSTVKKDIPSISAPSCKAGSIIYPSTQVLGEIIPLVGSSFNLNYFSNRVKGRVADYIIRIPISSETVLSDVTGYNLTIKDDLGSTIYSNSYGTSTNQSTTYTSNGLNGSSQEPWETVKYTVTVEEVSPDVIPNTTVVGAGNLKYKKLGIGGWAPSIWYFYDPVIKTLYKPDGTERTVQAKTLTGTFYQVPNETGTEVYIFDSTGKIVETKLGLTGQVIYSFYYDGSGRLSYINEPFSKTTTFNRNGSGVLTSITAPNGKVTTITHDGNGYLSEVENPNSESYEMTYHGTGGLLATFEKPNGAVSEFTYDGNGNLTKDEHSGGKEINLSKTPTGASSFDVSSETGMNREDIMSVSSSVDYSKQEELKADGSKFISENTANTSSIISHNDSVKSTYYVPDTVRFKNAVNFVNYTTENKFGQRITQFSNSITLNDPNDPFDIDTWVKVSSVGYWGSYPLTSTYDGSTKTTTTSTYLGKTTATEIDNYQRPVSIQRGSLNAVNLTYTNDKLTQLSQGTRDTTFTYNSTSKLLETVTNELSQTTSYTYNSAERLTKTTLPDSREINYVYDSRGNLTSITPPSKPAHTMTIGSKELITSYNPPTLSGVPTVNTTYAYNLDNQLTLITRPDSQTIAYDYGATTGRLNKITVPAGDYEYSYDLLGSNISLPTKIEAPDSKTIEFSNFYYGVASQSTVKDSSNNVIFDYMLSPGDHAQLGSEILYGYSGYFYVSYSYDGDEYVSQAGDIALTYDAPNGQLETTTLGDITDTWDYNAYGELEDYEAKYDGTTIYHEEFTRDGIGRVSQKIETLNSVTSTYDYTYDSAGRLTQVNKNSSTIATYTYDSNSNRNGGNNGTAITATYDNQDRMTAYKNYTFTYNANGELASATNTSTSQTVTYTYDVLGNLTQVVLPSKTITYEIDPLSRRLGRSDGTTSVRYAYDNKNKLIGEIDGSGALIRRYVYGSKAHVPDYFIDSSYEKYRIITDHLGSVRLVVRESDGVVMQRMEHDEFGRIVVDTNAGYQPFGFAGGIYDHETALVRFGARDYMPSAGRWTSKDPIRFAAGDSNIFGYVSNDPINFVDPSGLELEFGSSQARDELSGSMSQIWSTDVGRALISGLIGSSSTYTINTNSSGDNYASGNSVTVDPSSSPYISTNMGVLPASTTRILAHELGHLTGTSDSANINVNTWENPIMGPIDGIQRTSYGTNGVRCGQ